MVAVVDDPSVRRKVGPGKYVERPLTLIAEKQSSAAQAKSRAVWEQARRLGEMMKIKILVNGWGTREDYIWRENRKVRVTYPHAGLDGEYLIAGCRYIYGAGESVKTELTLTHKDAYAIKPGQAKVEEQFRWNLTRKELIALAKRLNISVEELLEIRPDINVVDGNDTAKGAETAGSVP